MSKFSWTKWTAKQEIVIREKYLKVGPKQLAIEMKVSEHALIRKAGKMGISFPKVVWTKEMDSLLRSKYSTEGPAKLAEDLKVPYWSLMRRAITLKVDKTRKLPPKDFEWAEETLEAIKNRYVKEGPKKLAKEFNISIGTVYRKAADMGLHTTAGYVEAGRSRAIKNDSCNIHYFDQWSPDMAYILGYIFADGSVNRQGTCLSFNLAVTDVGFLWHLKQKLQSRHALTRTRDVVSARTGNKCQDQVHLSISSIILVGRLNQLGVLPNKSYEDYPFPQVPDEVMPDFVRGFLDGDGTICITERDVCCIGFVGSPRFIQGLYDYLTDKLDISRVKIKRYDGVKAEKMCKVAWTAFHDMEKFRDFLYYDNHGFCLGRKKNKLFEWLSGDRKPRQSWTEFEDEMMRRFYHIMSPGKLGGLIGKSNDAVKCRARILGITRGKNGKPKPSK